MRDTFVKALCSICETNKDIELITGDLGLGVLKLFFEQFPGIRIYPDDPFFSRYGVDNAHRILREKASEPGSHGIHVRGLDLRDSSVMIDIRDIIVDRNLLMIFIRIDIVFQDGMESLF